MNRKTGVPGYAARTSANVVPARIDATALARSPMSAATSSSCGGLWQRTIRSVRSATAALSGRASPPISSARACARAASMSETSTGSPQPRASARAMFPAPMSPTSIAREATSEARGVSGLVEEALFDEAGPLLRADLDVARGEEEHLVGDPLHPAVERVGQAAGEVDQALGQIRLGSLEVEDDRDRVLELVRHVLR